MFKERLEKVARDAGMAVSTEKKNTIYDCPFMRVPKCFRQDIKKMLDIQICQACILGRIEKHLFDLVPLKPSDKYSKEKQNTTNGK